MPRGTMGSVVRWRLAVAAMLCLPAAARAAETCTDRVVLTGAAEVHGAILEKTPDGGLRVAVRRSWLDQHRHPALDELVAEDRRLVAEARADVRRRIEQRLAAQGDPPAVTELLRRELERLDREPDADSEFALLEIPRRQVRRVRPADPEHARLARWGWHDDLDDVESLSPPRLRALLVEAGVTPDAEPPSLADRLSPRPQDDREWAARMALVEDALGESVQFQGIGNAVVAVGGGGAGMAELGQLLPQLLGGNGAADLFGDLLGPANAAAAGGDRWLEAARGRATNGRHRATRVRPDPATGTATVESVFEVRLPDGTWMAAWRDVRTASPDDAPPGAADRILADPRMGPMFAALRGLGVGDPAVIDRAIAAGAATMAAQQACDARFAALRSDVVRRLDTPMLVLPED